MQMLAYCETPGGMSDSVITRGLDEVVIHVLVPSRPRLKH